MATTSQHQDLLAPLIGQFSLRVDHDLKVAHPGQSPSSVLTRCLEKVSRLIAAERPDVVIVQDPSIMDMVDVLAGLKPGGILLANAEAPFELPRKDIKAYFVPAGKIAIEIIGRPIMNTALIGALARITGLVGVEAVEVAVRERFPKEIAEKNVLAVRKAYEMAGGGQ